MRNLSLHERTLCAFIILLVAGLQGCKRIECGEYYRFVEDSNEREELTRWADEAVFSRSFAREEISSHGMDGPGPSPGNLAPSIASTLLPVELQKYNIRFLGSDSSRPDLVFLGLRKYQGVYVSRGEFASDLAKTRMTMDRLDAQEARVGVLCLAPFE